MRWRLGSNFPKPFVSNRLSTVPVNVCDGCGEPLAPGHSLTVCPKCLWKGAAKPFGPQEAGSPGDVEALEELSELLPDFEWLGVIGRGGMGTVYQARQKRLDRLVAVKVLSEEVSVESRFASRFEREAKILAQLNHPHIVTIHDFGQELGLYYLVMEYVNGVDLAALLRRGPLSVERSVRIARQLCAALVFAHERHILHRDIKPANILLDAAGLVKIADFGLAKLGRRHDSMATLTLAGSTMGTPRYMAPEQWERPDEVDHRADIFAFGMIFYELLTSEVPSGMIELPSTKISIDHGADHIVRKCLAQDPDKRYGNVKELEKDLVALEQTTALTAGNARQPSDSWLRPPPVIIAGDPSDASWDVTELQATGSPRPMMAVSQRSRGKFPWPWVFGALLVAVVALAMMVRDNYSDHSPEVQLATLPALTTGPWWFDDMPYLIPPVRQALARSKAIRYDVPRTAQEVTDLEAEIFQASRDLSETSGDPVLRNVLEPLLLPRSVNAERARTMIPPELASANPLWRHTQAIIDHRLGNLTEATQGYRDAVRAYRSAETPELGLLALCHADLARAYMLSGRYEECFESYDRAMGAVAGHEVPLFRVACLAGKADACRRFEAWEEAEEALLAARAELDGTGIRGGHPMKTYILQRFGWLYMDYWKLKDARVAFQEAISSRHQWLDATGDPTLFTRLRQQHDELALAMSQRYSGHEKEAIASYSQIRQKLDDMRQRVNRTPSIRHDWQLRYYNTCERLGDCFLFSEANGQRAAHLFHEAAADLQRELVAMNENEVPEFRVQYGRLLAKETIARVLEDDGGTDTVEAFMTALEKLELSGNHEALLKLFGTIAGMIVNARQAEEIPGLLTSLEALVEANQERQFGRDVRELFLLACRELAPHCTGELALDLAEAIVRLLPPDPVDPSVLPFFRPYFSRVIGLRLTSGELDWSTIRDVHWAKTGSRLGQDLPQRPLVIFYLEAASGYAMGFNPDETYQVVEIPHGYETLNALENHAMVANLIDGLTAQNVPFDVYWSDEGLIPPLTPDDLPVAVPEQARVY